MFGPFLGKLLVLPTIRFEGKMQLPISSRSPFSRFNMLPFGGRSTIVKLSSGDLWVLASTPLDNETKTKIGELGGQVKYIVGVDAEHTLYLRKSSKASLFFFC